VRDAPSSGAAPARRARPRNRWAPAAPLPHATMAAASAEARIARAAGRSAWRIALGTTLGSSRRVAPLMPGMGSECSDASPVLASGVSQQ
jgi:hypothetical protein